MTTLTTSISGLTRLGSTLPDIGQAVAPREPEPPRSPEARLNSLKLDTAVELNRRATPKAVSDQRRAPRYSLREVYGLDTDAVLKRLQAVDEDRDKPGWLTSSASLTCGVTCESTSDLTDATRRRRFAINRLSEQSGQVTGIPG